MSFWTVPESAPRLDALPARDRDVERQQDDGRGVDGHRRRHPVERDALEQRRHVLDRVDGDADSADLAGRQRVVRVVADLRRQVEGDAESGHALGEQVAVAAVRLGGGPESGVLPHRPGPAAVHRRLDAAGEGELHRGTHVGVRVDADEVSRREHGLDPGAVPMWCRRILPQALVYQRLPLCAERGRQVVCLNQRKQAENGRFVDTLGHASTIASSLALRLTPYK